MLWNFIQQYAPRLLRQRLGAVMTSQSSAAFRLPALQQQPPVGLELARIPAATSVAPTLQDALWFAVPKSKHSRSRKRKKTTVQKRLALKKNIVFDPQTGEVTLQHKLPFNWREYYGLPKMD